MTQLSLQQEMKTIKNRDHLQTCTDSQNIFFNIQQTEPFEQKSLLVDDYVENNYQRKTRTKS